MLRVVSEVCSGKAQDGAETPQRRSRCKQRVFAAPSDVASYGPAPVVWLVAIAFVDIDPPHRYRWSTRVTQAVLTATSDPDALGLKVLQLLAPCRAHENWIQYLARQVVLVHLLLLLGLEDVQVLLGALVLDVDLLQATHAPLELVVGHAVGGLRLDPYDSESESSIDSELISAANQDGLAELKRVGCRASGFLSHADSMLAAVASGTRSPTPSAAPLELSQYF